MKIYHEITLTPFEHASFDRYNNCTLKSLFVLCTFFKNTKQKPPNLIFTFILKVVSRPAVKKAIDIMSPGV